MSVPPQGPTEPDDAASARESDHVLRPPIDDAAFTAVFQEYYKTCLRLARRLVLDDGLAHEVVQEVFLSWWGTAGGAYRADRGDLGAWLATLTHHKAVDAVRTSERHRRLVAAARSALPQHPEQRSVEDVVWWELGTQRLLGALPVLTPAQRDVLGLAYMQGLTQAEIADRLGIPLGTVKSRTHSGMLRLRAAIGGTWTPTDVHCRLQRGTTDGSRSDPPHTSAHSARPQAAAKTTDQALRDDVDQCADALARIAAEETDDELRTAQLVSHAMALVDRHGETGMYALVVTLAQLVPAGATARRLA